MHLHSVLPVVFCLVLFNGEASHQLSVRHSHVDVSPHSLNETFQATEDARAQSINLSDGCKGISMGSDQHCITVSGTCFCFVSTQRPWTQARDYCKSFGLDLLSIEDQTKQIAVESIVPIITEGNALVYDIGLWTSGRYASSVNSFMWQANEKVFSFTNWRRSSMSREWSDCVRIVPSHQSQWSDAGCEQWLPSICEAPSRPSTKAVAELEKPEHDEVAPLPVKDAVLDGALQRQIPPCPSGFTQKNEMCCAKRGANTYCFVLRQQNWRTAEKYCKERGMKLASIETPEKQLEIEQAMSPVILQSKVATQIGVWTAGVYVPPSGFQYSWGVKTASSVTYANWIDSVDSASSWACIRLVPFESFKWSVVGCYEWLPSICQNI